MARLSAGEGLWGSCRDGVRWSSGAGADDQSDKQCRRTAKSPACDEPEARRPGQHRVKSELCAGSVGLLPALDWIIEPFDGQPIGRCPRLVVLLLDLGRRLRAAHQGMVQARKQPPDQLAGRRAGWQRVRIVALALHASTVPHRSAFEHAPLGRPAHSLKLSAIISLVIYSLMNASVIQGGVRSGLRSEGGRPRLSVNISFVIYPLTAAQLAFGRHLVQWSPGYDSQGDGASSRWSMSSDSSGTNCSRQKSTRNGTSTAAPSKPGSVSAEQEVEAGSSK